MFGMNTNRNQQPPAQEPPKQPDLTQMMELVQGIVTQVQNVQNRISDIEKTAQQKFQPPADSPYEGQPPQPATMAPVAPQPPKLGELSEEEMESISRRDLIVRSQQETIDALSASLGDIIKPLQDEIATLKKGTANDRIVSNFTRFKEAKDEGGNLRNPDLTDMLPYMKQIGESRPGLAVSDLYDLAKSNLQRSQPEVFSKIKEKYWPMPEVPAQREFGGIRPNLMSSERTEQVLGLDDAASKAANKMFQDVGPLPESNDMADFEN